MRPIEIAAFAPSNIKPISRLFEVAYLDLEGPAEFLGSWFATANQVKPSL